MSIGLRLLLAVALLLACAIAALWLYGRSLPQRHVAEGSRRIDGSLAAVAARIRDIDAHPRWRRGVQAIVPEPADTDGRRYLERGRHGEVRYELRELERDRLFESRIVDPGQPYGGRWLIRLQAESADATRVSIREEGEVHAPLYRVLGRHVFGYDTTLLQYLQDLADSGAFPDPEA